MGMGVLYINVLGYKVLCHLVQHAIPIILPLTSGIYVIPSLATMLYKHILYA